MTSPYRSTAEGSRYEPEGPLQTVISEISGKCDNCPSCRKECAFLRKYGTPKEIADAYDPADKTFLAMPFECSLCRLCAVVCPKKVKPSEMFLEMRREKVRRDPLAYPEHAGLLAYEKRGTSRLFSYYALPENCDTIFFPGCSLPGTRPEQTLAIYERLRKTIPGLGIVLDCCMKISHDLGREDHFQAMFGEMRNYLVKNNVQNVLVACPNCYRMFNAYGEGLKTGTVYEVLAESAALSAQRVAGTVTVHDPCAVRFSPGVHTAVRSLVARQGLGIEEMAHQGETTLCCGEGGCVASLSPELADAWGALRKDEANGKRAITYCVGCANRLNTTMPTSHIVDLLLDPRATLEGNTRVSRAPMTYLNRLRLKRRLRRTIKPPISRERTFTGEGETKRRGILKRVLLLSLLAAVILSARFAGITQYLEQETLRQWIQGYGGLAPVIYMLIYAIAPALLLPGLPLTIAGGILFGPFWGVLYTIISATVGACIAFLVARYIARDWVEKKLKSPRWRWLDRAVEEHGWKVVAFTRLIPLFPFNLLNYAFGLTGIRFFPYAVTTFICMLPACIAFIVFSSSLLELIRGRISLNFVAGLGLVILVSLIPLIYKRYKAKKGITDPL